MPKPSLGRIVLVNANPVENNGSNVAPAIITRVWSDDCVNLRVLADSSNAPAWLTSVKLYETEEEALASNPVGTGRVAWWPARV